MRKQFYKGDSGRIDNVGRGLAVFGKFAAVVREAALDTYQVEPDPDSEDSWNWIGASGCSGGTYTTEHEAFAAGRAWMRQDGWTESRSAAATAAIELARDRHEEHCRRSAAYKKQYETAGR